MTEQLRIPNFKPETVDNHSENLRAIDRWATTIGGELWEVIGTRLQPVPGPTKFEVSVTGDFYLSSLQQIELNVSGAGKTLFIDTSAGADIQIVSDTNTLVQAYDGGVVIRAGHSAAAAIAGSVVVSIDNGKQLNITTLPIANPGGTGNVWNNGGVLNIT